MAIRFVLMVQRRVDGPKAGWVQVTANIDSALGAYPPLYLPLQNKAPHISLENLGKCTKNYQQARIHVCFPANGSPDAGYVRIEDVGLKGGSKGVQLEVASFIQALREGYGVLGREPETLEDWRPFFHMLYRV